MTPQPVEHPHPNLTTQNRDTPSRLFAAGSYPRQELQVREPGMPGVCVGE